MVVRSSFGVAAEKRAVGPSSQDLDRMADCGSHAVMPVPCAISSLADVWHLDQAERVGNRSNLTRDDGGRMPRVHDAVATAQFSGTLTPCLLGDDPVSLRGLPPESLCPCAFPGISC